MKRLELAKKAQRKFFNDIKSASNLSWDELGKSCGLSGRSLRDWLRCKYTPSYEISIFLSKKFQVKFPDSFKILEPYWYIKKYAKKGAIARQKIYGLLGNKETRRKGGIISQQRRKENPEKYRLLGCQVRKKVKSLKPSVQLAELIGIMLGDGAITNSQIRVTLNRETDKDYAFFVRKLMRKVFGELPSVGRYHNVLTLTLSGISLVEELEKAGLKRGNKVTNQVSIPDWVLKNENYSKVCLRGLIDTDGSVYLHRHEIAGIKYVNLGLTFTNHSFPLIAGVSKILTDNHFSPSIAKNKGIFIYDLKEIERYFKIIKSDNPKHIRKLSAYLNLCKK